MDYLSYYLENQKTCTEKRLLCQHLLFPTRFRLKLVSPPSKFRLPLLYFRSYPSTQKKKSKTTTKRL